MNILYLSLAYPTNSQNLYSDLAEELVKKGHSVNVVVPNPKIENNKFQIKTRNGVEILELKTPPIFGVSNIKKALAFFVLPKIVKKFTKKIYSSKNFDLILFECPPVTMWKSVLWAKKYFKCPAFLQQKDIFPENLIDLQILTKKSPIYWYYRYQEVKMFKTADKIGCMSQANIDFIAKHNEFLNKEKLVYFPNAVSPQDIEKSEQKRNSICEKMSIPSDACIFLYGGNIGKPQCVEFFCDVLDRCKNLENVFFLCIGKGTHAHILKNFIKENKIKNALFTSALPRDEYEIISNNCDVGIVCLDPRFTIPNYPSKTLSYMQSALPILAGTDENSDYKDLILTEAKCGFWAQSNNPDAFVEKLKQLACEKNLRETFGNNGRKFFDENFDVKFAAQKLENYFDKKNNS